LSHFGFVLFLLGVLVAFSKADIISRNTSHYDLEDSKSNRENQVLMRGIPEKLGDYWVVYDSMRREKNYLHYTIKFYKDRNLENPVFTIHPDININNRMGNVYNPYTHHTVSKDIFTFITYADLASDYNNYDYLVDNEAEITIGDSIITGAGILVFRNISLVKASDSIDINNIIIKADFGLWRDTVEIPLSVEYRIVNGQKSFGDAVFDEGKYFLRFENIAQKPKTINIGLFKKRLNYIVIKTTVFPWISLMLVGGLLMFIGLFVSLAVNIK
jgi:cytochrome c-type biogenesis protein CcmF